MSYADNLANTFWKNVDTLRKAYGMTWNDIYESGLASKMFKAKTPPTMKRMASIAEILHTTVPELLDDSLHETPTEHLYIVTIGEWALTRLTKGQATFTKNWAAEPLAFFRDFDDAYNATKEFPAAEVEVWS